jgi:hypothetical protein
VWQYRTCFFFPLPFASPPILPIFPIYSLCLEQPTLSYPQTFFRPLYLLYYLLPWQLTGIDQPRTLPASHFFPIDQLNNVTTTNQRKSTLFFLLLMTTELSSYSAKVIVN